MTKRKIKGVKDADSPSPWYQVEIDNGLPKITEDLDGAIGADLRGVTPNVPDHVDLPNPAQAAMASDVIYAVTTAGEFIAYEPGTILLDYGMNLRAHLAWYDSETDEFTVLEFVE